MERLILFRHGRAQPDSESGDDFDRRLDAQGVRESAAMGATLAEMGFRPDLALVSPAVRAVETWDAAQPSFPKAVVRLEGELYLAEPAVIRRAAEAAGRAFATVMVVGHNPGLQELTVALLIEGGAPIDLVVRAQRYFPTGAAAVFLIEPSGRPHFDGLFLPERGA